MLVPNNTVWNSIIISHDLHQHPEAAPSDITRKTLFQEVDQPSADGDSAVPSPPPSPLQVAREMPSVTPSLGTVEFEVLRRVAWAELSGSKIEELMRRHAVEVDKLDHDQRMVSLWLAAEPQVHAQRKEWRDYTAAVGAVPEWIPLRIAYSLTRTDHLPLAHPAAQLATSRDYSSRRGCSKSQGQTGQQPAQLQANDHNQVKRNAG